MGSWEIRINNEDCEYSSGLYLAGDGYRCDHPKNSGGECKETTCPIAVLTNAMHSDGDNGAHLEAPEYPIGSGYYGEY